MKPRYSCCCTYEQIVQGKDRRLLQNKGRSSSNLLLQLFMCAEDCSYPYPEERRLKIDSRYTWNMFIRFQLISALVNIVVPSQNVVHNFTCHILKGLDFLQSQKIMHRSVRPPASSTARWPRRWTEGTAASRRSELQDSMDGCECEQPSYQVVNRGPDGYDCNWVCFGISFQQFPTSPGLRNQKMNLIQRSKRK